MAERLTPPNLARLFVRLRLRFLVNSFRGGARTLIPALLSLLASLALAVAGIGVAAALAGVAPDRAIPVVTVTTTLLGFAALVGPVFFSGVDDSFSPDRLAPYPLTRPARLGALAAAAAVSPVSVATLVALGAVAVVRCRSVVGAPVVVAATLSLWLLLVTTSRLLATAMARLSATRRGRDLTLGLGALVAATGWAWGPLLGAISSLRIERVERMAAIVRWTPPGALGRAMVLAGAGSVAAALPPLAIGLAGGGAASAGWWWALGRGDVPVGVGPGREGASDDPAAIGMFAGVLGRLPRTASGAVTARELKYLVRDPRQRVSVATLVVLAVALPVLNVARGEHTPAVTLVGASAGLLTTFASLNQIGAEGRASWIHLLSGVSPRHYLVGKNRALLVYLAPLVVLTTLILAALTGGWVYAPAAAGAGLGAMLAGLGVGSVNSVRAPVPVPEGSNPFAAAGGEGCLAGLISLVSLTVVALIMAPVAVALGLLRQHPGWCTVVGLIALPYGALVWAGGLRLAARAMAGREPELAGATAPLG